MGEPAATSAVRHVLVAGAGLAGTLVVPAPWNRGRVVLIGDAAHACPPTLAQA